MSVRFTVIGAHGLAAVEAMALGKPVVCYIKPSMVAQYPPTMPFISANQDNLAEVIACLLSDAQKRREIGMLSRAYIEKYHDAHIVTQDHL